MEKSNFIVSIFGVVIAAFALGFSWYAYKISNSQFTILNQGYLAVEGGVEPAVEKIGQYSPGAIVTPETAFWGLNFSLTFTNTGNIPLKYSVDKFDVYINHVKVSEIDKGLPEAILYPKVSLNYTHQTVHFFPDKRTLTLQQLHSLPLKIQFHVMYHDLGNDHQKTLDREMIFEVFENGQVRPIVSEVKDTI